MFRVRFVETYDAVDVDASWFGVENGLVQFYRGERVQYAVPLERVIDIVKMGEVETDAVEAETAGIR